MPKNLFKKGPDPKRNMKGRPRGMSLNDHLQRAIEELGGKIGGKDMTHKELIVRVLIAKAEKGEPWAHHIIWERIEGPVPTQITGAKGAPLIPNQHLDLSGWSDEMLMKFIDYLEKKRISEARAIEIKPDNSTATSTTLNEENA